MSNLFPLIFVSEFIIVQYLIYLKNKSINFFPLTDLYRKIKLLFNVVIQYLTVIKLQNSIN